MNIMGFVALGVSVVVFAAVYALLRKRPLGVRLVATAGLAILALPSLFVVLYYGHFLPETESFYAFRALRGSEFAILGAAAAAGAFASILPPLLLAFPLFALLLIGTLPYLKPLLSPLDRQQMHDRWNGVACLQSTSSTCGPASLATALGFLGVRISERDIAEKAFSYSGGTEAWYLARVARDLGFRATFRMCQSFDPKVPVPAIVGVKIGGMGHFIVILSHEDGRTTFVDPLSGPATVPAETLHLKYRFTGFHLAIQNVQ